MKEKVSLAVINRLPRYYRYLGDLLDAGITKISSQELSEKMGTTASQVRQDLNCFGGFGQQGYGYNVELLYKEIASILGLDRKYTAILIGVGKLGNAILNRITFEKRGFKLIALFDNNPEIIGQEVRGLKVLDVNTIDDFCRIHKPDVAFLTLPREAVPGMAIRLEKLGIKGFWNFSSGYVKLENKEIPVENVHLGDSLMTLCYRVNELEKKLQNQNKI